MHHSSTRPRRAAPATNLTGWRRSLAAISIFGLAVASIVTIGLTTRATTQAAFANQVPAAIVLAREEGASRAGVRPALSIAELADQRARLLEQAGERVEDSRNQTAFTARQSELAGATRAIKAESKRLRTLDDFFIRLAGRMLHTNTVNLVVAVGFTIMGIAIILQANATDMTGGDSPLVPVGDWLTWVFKDLLAWTSPVPEPVLGLALLGLVATFVAVTLRDRQRATPPVAEAGVPPEPIADEISPGEPATQSRNPH